MNLFVDILLITSAVLFIAGITGVLVKAFNEKLKLRYLFISSILCFSLSLAFGWQDAVDGFMEGWNSVDCNDATTGQVDVQPE